ncbi:hypothetical protein DUI70_3613 [Streptomyces albus]|nr:hypothetical protein DUI70_3613 [Streptomyces albus]
MDPAAAPRELRDRFLSLGRLGGRGRRPMVYGASTLVGGGERSSRP